MLKKYLRKRFSVYLGTTEVGDGRNHQLVAMGLFLSLTILLLLPLSNAQGTNPLSASNLLDSHFGTRGLAASSDYVVVGGSTAGLAIAQRLAATPSFTVAVIEAGNLYEFSNGNHSQLPPFASEFTALQPTQINPYVDWYIYSEPQPVM